MAAWGAMSPGKRVLVLVLGAGVAAGAAFLVLQSMQQPMPEQDSADSPEEPIAAVAPSTATAPVPEAAPEVPPEPALPRIDTWRVAADGEALVAGTALPGATVAVVVDDQPVAEGMAMASGEFVLQFTLPPNPSPSLLWLTMAPTDGPMVVSPEIVALAPIRGPDLAASEPDPEAPVAGSAEADSEAASAAGAAPVEAESAEATPPALLVTDEGTILLQDDGATDPAPTLQVTVDTITYTPAGEVQIGGSGADGATLRLYLDNSETAVAAVPADGRWLVTLGDIAPGVYTLRVDQLDASGKVTSRYETPFKRETLEALALASGVSNTDVAVTAEEPSPPVEATPEPATSAATESPASPSATEPAQEPQVSALEATVPDPASPVVPAAAPASETAPVDDPAPQVPVTITVQPGFTLWGIAQERFGDGVLYVQVFEANRDKIRDPDLIYPGQVISLPESPAP